MKSALEQIAVKITGCKAEVVESEAKTPGWRTIALRLAHPSGRYVRVLLTIVVPPYEWPVRVDYHHFDPSQITGYPYEWGRDPNKLHPNNPPTIDDEQELGKVLRGLMTLPETSKTLSAMKGEYKA